MSRGSRGRHRRRGRAGRTVDATVPLAVGGAVAAVALVGPSVGVKLLRPEESPASAGPQAEGSRERGTLMTFSEPSTPGPVASLVPRVAGSATSRSADRDASGGTAVSTTESGGGTWSTTSAAPTDGVPSESTTSPVPSPSTTSSPDERGNGHGHGNGNGNGPTSSVPLPSTTVSLPLPTLSPTALP